MQEFGIRKLEHGTLICNWYHPNIDLPIIQQKAGRDIFVTHVYHDEIKLAEELTKNFWGKRKKGTWGEGFIENPFVRGKIGEIAFSRIFGTFVDFNYREYGDKKDVVLLNFSKIFNVGADTMAKVKTVEIKTASTYNLSCLLRAVSDNGINLELKNDFYVFLYINSPYDEIDYSSPIEIALWGVLQKEDVASFGITGPRAKGGKHKNYDFEKEDTYPIGDLYNFYYRDGR